eukprot:GHVU01061429.1.p1 GENE.GHVU01061429.1~~GHVU01061429.1.p1  ORF type:complete len:169 (+),score=15.22 GHVU01061429.1:277-783(+)
MHYFIHDCYVQQFVTPRADINAGGTILGKMKRKVVAPWSTKGVAFTYNFHGGGGERERVAHPEDRILAGGVDEDRDAHAQKREMIPDPTYQGSFRPISIVEMNKEKNKQRYTKQRTAGVASYQEDACTSPHLASPSAQGQKRVSIPDIEPALPPPPVEACSADVTNAE